MGGKGQRRQLAYRTTESKNSLHILCMLCNCILNNCSILPPSLFTMHVCIDCPYMVLTGPSFCSHSNGSTQWEHPEITEVFKDVGESAHSWCMLDGYPDASGVHWSLPLWGLGTKLSACPHNQPTDLLNEDAWS